MNIFEYLETHHSDAGFEPPLSEHPVLDPPGSDAKFRAMVSRIERGEELFHPLDLGLPSNTESSGNFFR